MERDSAMNVVRVYYAYLRPRTEVAGSFYLTHTLIANPRMDVL